MALARPDRCPGTPWPARRKATTTVTQGPHTRPHWHVRAWRGQALGCPVVKGWVEELAACASEAGQWGARRAIVRGSLSVGVPGAWAYAHLYHHSNPGRDGRGRALPSPRLAARQAASPRQQPKPRQLRSNRNARCCRVSRAACTRKQALELCRGRVLLWNEHTASARG